MNQEQREQYLRDVSQTGEKIKEYIKLQHDPKAQQQEEQKSFERVPLPNNLQQQLPMLSLNATAGSGSTLEMWEENVDQRLNDIDRKLNGSDLSSMFATGKVEQQLDF